VLRPDQQQLDISMLGHPSHNQSAKHCGQHKLWSATDTQPRPVTPAPQADRESVLTPSPQPSTSSSSTEATLDVAASAAQAIQQDKISLNAKFAIFAIIGMTEPRTVKLFPAESCSCPVKSSCYHVLTACMAVGLRQENSSRPLNLTQLRSNKRKKANKTRGRRRPRTPVVPDGDTNPNVAIMLAEAACPFTRTNS